jgi:hypothetical protein
MTLSRRALLMSLPALGAAGSASAQESADPIEFRWSRPFPRLSELAVSGDGQRIAALSLEGKLAYLDVDGHLLWERPAVDASAIAVSRTGDLLVAWSRSDHDESKLLFFNGAGRCFAAPALSEAPACVAISGDGKRVAVGNGDAITLFGISPKGMVTRQIQAAGRVRRIIAANGDTFVVVTEPPCRIALIKSRGSELWHRELPENAHCSVVVSTDGKQLAIAYEKSPEQIEVLMTTWKNEELWKTARPGRGGSVRMNAAGGFLLLAYDHLVEHQQQSRYERRLAYLGEGGVGGWTKGGALTAPLPVALDSRGEWLVALDNERSRSGSRFRLYGKDGTRQWIYTAPAGIHLATASVNGRTIAVYQADDTLTVLRVNAAGGG